ncbi:hypothetical protein [Enterococcus villorum]
MNENGKIMKRKLEISYGYENVFMIRYRQQIQKKAFSINEIVFIVVRFFCLAFYFS